MSTPEMKPAARAGAAGDDAKASNSTAKATTEPEFGKSRRRFLIAMFMCGAVDGDRIVERVAADIKTGGTPNWVLD